MKNKKKSEDERPTISFRLDCDLAAELISRASRQRLSHHQLAQHYVTEMLCAEIKFEALHDTVRRLNERLQIFQVDFAFSVQTLLECGGKLTRQQAEAWVEAAIKPE